MAQWVYLIPTVLRGRIVQVEELLSRFVSLSLKHSVGRRIDELERGPVAVPKRPSSELLKLIPLTQIGRVADGDAVSGSVPATYVYDNNEELALADPSPGRAEGADIFSGVQSTLPEVEDARYWHPDESAPLRRVSSKPVRRYVDSSGNRTLLRAGMTVPWGVSPEAKSSVIMCIRRHTRRGVLLALDRGGRNRKPTKSATSDIWC